MRTRRVCLSCNTAAEPAALTCTECGGPVAAVPDLRLEASDADRTTDHR